MPSVLCSLQEHGFALFHLKDTFVKSGPTDETTWEGFEMPQLEEITGENLKYDLDDARKMQSRTLGCSAPEDVR